MGGFCRRAFVYRPYHGFATVETAEVAVAVILYMSESEKIPLRFGNSEFLVKFYTPVNTFLSTIDYIFLFNYMYMPL